MNLLEYLVAMTVLRAVSLATAWVPVARDRVVLATARTSVLEGNLAYLDAAIRAHGKAGSDGFLCLGRTNGYHHNFGCLAFFLQAQRFFNRNFVEWIHRHLDVGQFDARTIRLHADFHVVIDHTFDRHENFHERQPAKSSDSPDPGLKRQSEVPA